MNSPMLVLMRGGAAHSRPVCGRLRQQNGHASHGLDPRTFVAGIRQLAEVEALADARVPHTQESGVRIGQRRAN